MKFSKLFVPIFFGLSVVATIFPPFVWGEDLFKEVESTEVKMYLSQEGGLPIKKYAFLFGDSKQKFYSGVWFWNENEKRSQPFYVTAQRRLLVAELLLEYVLALILASFAAFAMSIKRSTRLLGTDSRNTKAVEIERVRMLPGG